MVVNENEPDGKIEVAIVSKTGECSFSATGIFTIQDLVALKNELSQFVDELIEENMSIEAGRR